MQTVDPATAEPEGKNVRTLMDADRGGHSEDPAQRQQEDQKCQKKVRGTGDPQFFSSHRIAP